MLDLVRLSPRPIFPPGGPELYHQLGILTGMAEGDDVLVVPCGEGLSLEYFVQEFGVQGSGVEPDAGALEKAEARARRGGLPERLHFQPGSADDLPYRDGVFDVVVGELGLTRSASPEDSVRELVRVARPGGRVVLVQPVWKSPMEAGRKELLARHLGARPLMLGEWKELLRDAGVEGLHAESWSGEATGLRPAVQRPFPDFAELFSVPEKLRILRRAWSRWGWRGVHTALSREMEVHRLLTREQVLGLDLVQGLKSARPPEPVSEPGQGEPEPTEESEGATESGGAPEGEGAADGEGTTEEDGGTDVRRSPDGTGSPGASPREVQGLPLFAPGSGPGDAR